MDRIELFRIFSRVVECASFTRAADTLGVPRSSVSAAVQELEGRVGARLLHRTTRKVSPTQDGAAFYARCQRVIAEVEELVPIGALDPDQIHTPGIFVQRIFQGARYVKQIENRTVRKRAAS